jgi:hypothetical protein
MTLMSTRSRFTNVFFHKAQNSAKLQICEPLYSDRDVKKLLGWQAGRALTAQSYWLCQ